MHERRPVLTEPILVDVDNRPVADLLVDMVGGWVTQIGKQKAEAPALVEHELANSRDARAGITPAAELRRRVHWTNPRTVWRAAKNTRKSYGLAVFPEEVAGCG